MLDQQWIFCVYSRTLLIDILWRQSMLQIIFCGGKAKHTANMHNILLESLLSDV